MVFELLGQSVFDFLKENEFHPFPAHHIQHFARQLLTSVACKIYFSSYFILLVSPPQRDVADKQSS
jgi:dual-specificity kinase